jgi:hypothetical protein
MIGHDGATVGQFSYLRVYPDHRLAFALLTNSASLAMFADLERDVHARFLGGAAKSADVPAPVDLDPARYVGTYGNVAAAYEISAEGAGLRLAYRASDVSAVAVDARLMPFGRDLFEVRESGTAIDGQKLGFSGDDARGRAVFARLGWRMGVRDFAGGAGAAA